VERTLTPIIADWIIVTDLNEVNVLLLCYLY
jgi:hypothetical protein